MDHVAILNPSWKLLPKIISGEKKVESRWYKARFAPWDKIRAGEMVYFKNSGQPVTAKAEVEQVLQFSDLTPKKVRGILEKYGAKIAVSNMERPYQWAKDKRYCVLVFLKNAREVPPFKINKSGFGNMAAWMCVDKITDVRV